MPAVLNDPAADGRTRSGSDRALERAEVYLSTCAFEPSLFASSWTGFEQQGRLHSSEVIATPTRSHVVLMPLDGVFVPFQTIALPVGNN